MYTFVIKDVYNGVREQLHDDVIKWKHFPRYWPFVTWSFDVFFDLRLNQRVE